MATYQDKNGKEFQVKTINNAMVRQLRKMPDLEWLADAGQVLGRLADPVQVADAIAYLTGASVEEIDAGMGGDAILRAQDAIIEAFAGFLPSDQMKVMREIVAEYRASIKDAGPKFREQLKQQNL